MKCFSGKLAIGGAIGITLLMAGCQDKEADSAANPAPAPAPAAPPKPKTYSEFTIVKQPDDKSESRRGGYPPIVIGIPQSLIPLAPVARPGRPGGPGRPGRPTRPEPPKPIGTAKLVDDAGHSANLGTINPPDRGETETQVFLTRGYSWKWSHPKLEIDIPGQAPKTLPLKDLPEPETVDLSGSPAPAGSTCEIIPSLADYGIASERDNGDFSKDAGLLLISPALGPESETGTSCQVMLQDTQSAKGLGYAFHDVASTAYGAGAKFVPFRFAAATSKIRLAVRKTQNIEEVQDVQFPGCKLVQKFNATTFQVDKDITVKGSNGWTFTLKAQMDGPVREPRKDPRSFKIDVAVHEPQAGAPAEAEGEDGGGGRGRRGGPLGGLRRRDADRMKSSPSIEMVAPKLEDLGLKNVFVGGTNYSNAKLDAPVKYGEFTLHLKIKTLTVKEISADTMVLSVNKTTRKPVK